MDKQPAFYVGVDQFTVVLRFVGQLEDLERWPAQVKRIVDAFVKLSELETFFGKLVRGRGNRPANYVEALTYDTVPWDFSIAWHPTQPKLGVCVSFSAYAWAVYQEAFVKHHQRQTTVAGFLQHIQCEQYTTRLSRIDIMADYFNYGELLSVHNIYSALSKQELIVIDRNNKKNLRTIESREKTRLQNSKFTTKRSSNLPKRKKPFGWTKLENVTAGQDSRLLIAMVMPTKSVMICWNLGSRWMQKTFLIFMCSI